MTKDLCRFFTYLLSSFIFLVGTVDGFCQVLTNEDVQIYKDIVFTVVDGNELKLDIAVPKYLKSPAPAIVDIPGGAWRTVNKSVNDAIFYAEYGFIGVSITHRLNGGYTRDKISMSQTINDDLTKINTPVNVDYNYAISSNSNFSTPIRPLGVTVNASFNESWSKGTSIVNSEDNIQTVLTHSINVRLSNRRQDKIDITTGGAETVTDAMYSLAKQMNNVYYNTTYCTTVYFTANDQLTFGTEANIVNFNAESFKESVQVPLVSASIQYFFGRGIRPDSYLRPMIC